MRALYVALVRTSYVVTLRGLRFHTLIGILPHERELRQPVEVDVSVWPHFAEPSAGQLFDYRLLYGMVADVIREGPIDYLEGLVGAVAERVMATGHAHRVRVAARKPNVMLGGPVECAEVAVDLEQDD